MAEFSTLIPADEDMADSGAMYPSRDCSPSELENGHESDFKSDSNHSTDFRSSSNHSTDFRSNSSHSGHFEPSRYHFTDYLSDAAGSEDSRVEDNHPVAHQPERSFSEEYASSSDHSANFNSYEDNESNVRSESDWMDLRSTSNCSLEYRSGSNHSGNFKSDNSVPEDFKLESDPLEHFQPNKDVHENFKFVNDTSVGCVSVSETSSQLRHSDTELVESSREPVEPRSDSKAADSFKSVSEPSGDIISDGDPGDFKSDNEHSADIKSDSSFKSNSESSGDIKSDSGPSQDFKSDSDMRGGVKSDTKPSADFKSDSDRSGDFKSDSDPSADFKSDSDRSGDFKSDSDPSADFKSDSDRSGEFKSDSDPSRSAISDSEPLRNAMSDSDPSTDVKSDSEASGDCRASLKPGTESSDDFKAEIKTPGDSEGPQYVHLQLPDAQFLESRPSENNSDCPRLRSCNPKRSEVRPQSPHMLEFKSPNPCLQDVTSTNGPELRRATKDTSELRTQHSVKSGRISTVEQSTCHTYDGTVRSFREQELPSISTFEAAFEDTVEEDMHASLGDERLFPVIPPATDSSDQEQSLSLLASDFSRDESNLSESQVTLSDKDQSFLTPVDNDLKDGYRSCTPETEATDFDSITPSSGSDHVLSLSELCANSEETHVCTFNYKPEQSDRQVRVKRSKETEKTPNKYIRRRTDLQVSSDEGFVSNTSTTISMNTQDIRGANSLETCIPEEPVVFQETGSIASESGEFNYTTQSLQDLSHEYTDLATQLSNTAMTSALEEINVANTKDTKLVTQAEVSTSTETGRSKREPFKPPPVRKPVSTLIQKLAGRFETNNAASEASDEDEQIRSYLGETQEKTELFLNNTVETPGPSSRDAYKRFGICSVLTPSWDKKDSVASLPSITAASDDNDKESSAEEGTRTSERDTARHPSSMLGTSDEIKEDNLTSTVNDITEHLSPIQTVSEEGPEDSAATTPGNDISKHLITTQDGQKDCPITHHTEKETSFVVEKDEAIDILSPVDPSISVKDETLTSSKCDESKGLTVVSDCHDETEQDRPMISKQNQASTQVTTPSTGDTATPDVLSKDLQETSGNEIKSLANHTEIEASYVVEKDETNDKHSPFDPPIAVKDEMLNSSKCDEAKGLTAVSDCHDETEQDRPMISKQNHASTQLTKPSTVGTATQDVLSKDLHETSGNKIKSLAHNYATSNMPERTAVNKTQTGNSSVSRPKVQNLDNTRAKLTLQDSTFVDSAVKRLKHKHEVKIISERLIPVTGPHPVLQQGGRCTQFDIDGSRDGSVRLTSQKDREPNVSVPLNAVTHTPGPRSLAAESSHSEYREERAGQVHCRVLPKLTPSGSKYKSILKPRVRFSTYQRLVPSTYDSSSDENTKAEVQKHESTPKKKKNHFWRRNRESSSIKTSRVSLRKTFNAKGVSYGIYVMPVTLGPSSPPTDSTKMNPVDIQEAPEFKPAPVVTTKGKHGPEESSQIRAKECETQKDKYRFFSRKKKKDSAKSVISGKPGEVKQEIDVTGTLIAKAAESSDGGFVCQVTKRKLDGSVHVVEERISRADSSLELDGQRKVSKHLTKRENHPLEITESSEISSPSSNMTSTEDIEQSIEQTISKQERVLPVVTGNTGYDVWQCVMEALKNPKAQVKEQEQLDKIQNSPDKKEVTGKSSKSKVKAKFFHRKSKKGSSKEDVSQGLYDFVAKQIENTIVRAVSSSNMNISKPANSKPQLDATQTSYGTAICQNITEATTEEKLEKFSQIPSRPIGPIVCPDPVNGSATTRLLPCQDHRDIPFCDIINSMASTLTAARLLSMESAQLETRALNKAANQLHDVLLQLHDEMEDASAKQKSDTQKAANTAVCDAYIQLNKVLEDERQLVNLRTSTDGDYKIKVYQLAVSCLESKIKDAINSCDSQAKSSEPFSAVARHHASQNHVCQVPPHEVQDTSNTPGFPETENNIGTESEHYEYAVTPDGIKEANCSSGSSEVRINTRETQTHACPVSHEAIPTTRDTPGSPEVEYGTDCQHGARAALSDDVQRTSSNTTSSRRNYRTDIDQLLIIRKSTSMGSCVKSSSLSSSIHTSLSLVKLDCQVTVPKDDQDGGMGEEEKACLFTIVPETEYERYRLLIETNEYPPSTGDQLLNTIDKGCEGGEAALYFDPSLSSEAQQRYASQFYSRRIQCSLCKRGHGN